MGITDLAYVPSGKDCSAVAKPAGGGKPAVLASDYSMLNIFNWYGTVVGNEYQGTYSRGSRTGGVAIPALAGVKDINYWKAGRFCAKRLKRSTTSTQLTDFKNAATDACP